MWTVLGATVDLVHALAMVAWIAGLPLLVLPRWPRLRRAYAIYALVFVGLSQLSMLWLGECFLTTIARALWNRAPSGGWAGTDDWFTVQLARAVFGLSPSHRAISIVSESLIVVTALLVLYSLRRPAHAQQIKRVGAS